MTKSIREIDSRAKTTSKNSRIKKGRRFDGTTWSSQHFIDDYINEIGEVKKVDICGEGVGRSVVIKGTEGELRPIGFGVGYSGTGARGLVETCTTHQGLPIITFPHIHILLHLDRLET